MPAKVHITVWLYIHSSNFCILTFCTGWCELSKDSKFKHCFLSIDWKCDRKCTNCKNMHPQKTDIKAVQSLKLLLFYLSCEWTQAQRMVSTVWANGKRMVSAHWTEFCKHLWIVNGEWTQDKRSTNASTKWMMNDMCTYLNARWAHCERTEKMGNYNVSGTVIRK